MLESYPLRLGETCKGSELTVDLCVGWAECLEYGQRVKKTGVEQIGGAGSKVIDVYAFSWGVPGFAPKNRLE